MTYEIVKSPMSELKSHRLNIEKIHKEVVSLFRQRLAETHEIWILKNQLGLPLDDLDRENYLIHQFDDEILNEEERKSVQQLIQFMIKESKKFAQEKL